MCTIKNIIPLALTLALCLSSQLAKADDVVDTTTTTHRGRRSDSNYYS